MKTRSPLLIAAPLTLAVLLSACSKPDAEQANANATDAAANNAAPLELPPMMTASHTYRCKDNSLVYIDFFNNGTAIYKTEKSATGGVELKSEGEGKPYVAEGYSVSGATKEITLTAPGKGTTNCKA